jgi:glutamyl/glutaminyl-tRNA synthetase
MANHTTFRTRQAPSPTGYLHIGSLRQMLFSRLFAIINNGIFYVRLEDTDRTRLVADSAKEICQSLDMLGLEPDEGITLQKTEVYSSFYGIYQKGDFAPYIQSERLEIYHQHCQNLLDKNLAYWSFLTDEQKQELQDIKQATKNPINYYKTNLELATASKMSQSVADGLNDPQKPVLMYKLNRNQKVEVEDLLLGKTTFDLALEEDFVILKSDGYPTYHFAHLVDDRLMQTTMVIRAQEWYPSLAKHWTMFMDYWNQVPQYLHLPFILGETGNKKLSKRDGSVRTMDYLQNGYLPEAIINYLAFLGWNPGTDKELYLDKTDFILEPHISIDEQIQARLEKLLQNLSQNFSLDKLSKAPARFNLEKLNWYNREYIKMMSLEEFCYRGDMITQQTSPTEYKVARILDKNRITTLNQIGIESRCVYDYLTPNKELLQWKKISLEQSLANLQELWEVMQPWFLEIEDQQNQFYDVVFSKIKNRQIPEQMFEKLANWWEIKTKTWLKENNKQAGDYLWSLRVALSGLEKSPSPFELFAILNKEEIKNRVKRFFN